MLLKLMTTYLGFKADLSFANTVICTSSSPHKSESLNSDRIGFASIIADPQIQISIV